jgi:hypothetical protein
MAYFIFGYFSMKLGKYVDGHEKIIAWNFHWNRPRNKRWRANIAQNLYYQRQMYSNVIIHSIVDPLGTYNRALSVVHSSNLGCRCHSNMHACWKLAGNCFPLFLICRFNKRE